MEDYVHVAVDAVVCGQVRIGYAAFVGANSTIIQKMCIRDSRKHIYWSDKEKWLLWNNSMGW